MKRFAAIFVTAAALGMATMPAHAQNDPGGFAAPNTQSEAALLLPAVQAAREAPRRPSGSTNDSQADIIADPGLGGGTHVRQVSPGGLPSGFNQSHAPRSMGGNSRMNRGVSANSLTPVPFHQIINNTIYGGTSPTSAGQEGSDLLIVNNGDGSDFLEPTPANGFQGGVRVATGDVND